MFDTLNEYARMADNVPVDVAAAICGVNPQTLRQGIERGTVPFAFETTRAGSSRKSFVISPAARFADVKHTMELLGFQLKWVSKEDK